MDKALLETLLPDVERIAEIAGREILRIYSAGFSVQDKADKTPVTDADLAAHHSIVDGLQKLDWDFPILSEESKAKDFEERQHWETYWLVDPLDGTKEFIKRNGEFSVNIALIHQHEPVLGVVHAPVLEATYAATRGNGATKAQNTSEKKTISVADAHDSVRIAASRSHPSQRLDSYLQRVGEHSVVPMGSSLKSCLVAEGKADLYPRLGKTSEWDTAACQCIVEEAGGYLITADGEPMRYNTKSSLLNPEFFVFGDDSRDWVGYLEGI